VSEKKLLLGPETLNKLRSSVESTLTRSDRILSDHYTKVNTLSKIEFSIVIELLATASMVINHIDTSLQPTREDGSVEISALRLTALGQLLKLVEKIKAQLPNISFETQ
jgi:hypothetical protein